MNQLLNLNTQKSSYICAIYRMAWSITCCQRSDRILKHLEIVIFKHFAKVIYCEVKWSKMAISRLNMRGDINVGKVTSQIVA